MNSGTELRVGDFVEVRSKEEILRTLDKDGRFEQVPFMPQMLEYCGKRFRVSKRAHKFCDTVNSTGARQINNVVHLEDLRCSGGDYDGCQSACLLYFKEVWLKPVQAAAATEKPIPNNAPQCTEADLIAATRVKTPGTDEVRYLCQATQLPYASKPLSMLDIGQYIEDCKSGNTQFREMMEPILFEIMNRVITAGVGVSTPLRWAYDKVQHARGKTPYPWRPAKIPKGGRTPSQKLDLQPGEWVRVKSYEQILETLDEDYRNRGMYFNAELAYYCGGTFQVVSRVDKIMDEQKGRLLRLKNDCIVLAGTDCIGRFTQPLFCPRGGYTYWREIWLERVSGPDPARATAPPCAAGALPPCTRQDLSKM